MREAFHEEQTTHHDPVDGDSFHSATDFDWPELERRLGEALEDDAEQVARLSSALREIFRWVITCPPDGSRRGGLSGRIGRRTLALCWIVAPDILSGSQRHIARRVGALKILRGNG